MIVGAAYRNCDHKSLMRRVAQVGCIATEYYIIIDDVCLDSPGSRPSLADLCIIYVGSYLLAVF